MQLKYCMSLLSRVHSTWIKGLLTILIILGHDVVFTESLKEYGVMSYLYLFHIQGFFLLPFLYGIKGDRNARDLFVRFYWPFFWLVSLALLIRGLLTEFNDLSFGSLFRLYLICDASSIREVCGIQVFWFLPSMMMTMMLMDQYYKSSTLFRSLILIMSLTLMACDIYSNTSYQNRELLSFLNKMPLGSSYALVMLGLGVTFRYIFARVVNNNAYGMALIISFIGFIICSVCYLKEVALTISISDLNVTYSILRLVTPLFFMTGCVCAIQKWRTINKKSAILKLGHRSLYVYLISPFVGYLVLYISKISGIFNWPFGLLMCPVITIVAYFLSLCVTPKVQTIIFPRNYKDLISTLKSLNL